MISKREISRRYAQLLMDVSQKEYYTKVDLTNRVNCYTCSEGHITKTKNIDAGVTPMFIQCETCNSQARSSFFADIAPLQEATQEWYRPDLKKTLKLKDAMLDHVLRGGLMVRKILKR